MARKSDKLSTRNIFYIITNGEQTECNYFKLLRAYRSIYDVKIIFENSDPLGLVEYAIQNINDANQIWCVFDIDNTHQDNRLVPAIKKAETNGIKIAYSNLAFEVWLISHFEKCEKELTVTQHKAILDRQLQKFNQNLEYNKTNKKLLSNYFIPHYKQAIENAKVVYQNYVKEHKEKFGINSRYRIWDWNSSTNVFLLVEALKLQIQPRMEE